MSVYKLQETLVKTTKILAGKNLPVHLEGFAPRVEYDAISKQPTRIFIPALPVGAPKKLIDAIHGYIDHECSHIVLSDSDDICDTKKGKLWHYIHNCIEDPRVNKGMGQIYPGCKHNIKRGYDYIFTELKDEMTGLSPYSREFLDKQDLSDPETKAKFQLQYASLWFAGKMGCSLSKDKFDELELDRFYEDLLAKADPEWLKRLADIKSAQDVREASDYWTDFFDEEVLKKMQPEGGGEKGKMTPGKGTPEEFMKTLEEQLADLIKNEVEKAVIEAREYVYWTDRFDKKYSKHDIVKQIEHRGRTQDVAGFENETLQVSNYLAKDLRRMLEERNRRYYIGGYKSGKLNTKTLHSVRCGNDRIFKKKNDIREVNACVSLLVDMSGSMMGERIGVAMQSAYAFAMTLQQLKVPFEVYGFVTENSSPHMQHEFDKYIAKNKSVMPLIINESSPENFYAFKEFEENFDYTSKKAMTGAGNSQVSMQQNEDSKHVLLALQRLAARPEKVKALFVFSDGTPCFHGNSHHSSEQLKFLDRKSKERYGVDIYAIGIQSVSVSSYYRANKVVKNLKDLPTALFEFLRKIF
jgi:hypothetical protein